jgi:murein DD-endopeptidase MepM/ murein hydrolase activator NlpD
MFVEAERTFSMVRGREFRHQPNGGYGLPVQDQRDGQHLLHVGADFGWHQVGEPVFAIADGVVRVATGPSLQKRSRGADGTELLHASDLAWGNLIAIEHRFAGDAYFTSVYGHLNSIRFVTPGERVTAGQVMGTIGRQHARINGGYIPHLHFAVREGRRAEIGRVLFEVDRRDQRIAMTIASLTDATLFVAPSHGPPRPLSLNVAGREFSLVPDGEHLRVSSELLWFAQPKDFEIVGYALTTQGWRDPVAFLREHNADTRPAPFQLPPSYRRTK